MTHGDACPTSSGVKATCARGLAMKVKARIGLGLGIKQSNKLAIELEVSGSILTNYCLVFFMLVANA